MGKNRKVLIILAVVMGVLCLAGSAVFVKMTYFSNREFSDKITEDDIPWLIMDHGFSGRDKDDYQYFLTNDVEYSVSINNKDYTNLELVTIVFNAREEEDGRYGIDVLFFIWDNDSKEVVDRFFGKSLIYSDEKQFDYSRAEVIVNPKNSINDNCDLSFYLKYKAYYHGEDESSIVNRIAFFDVNSIGYIHKIFSEGIGGEFTRDYGRSNVVDNREIKDIEFSVDDNGKYEEIIITMLNTISGEINKSIDVKDFMDYAFDSFDNYSVIKDKVSQKRMLSSVCPEYSEETKEVYAFDSQGYKRSTKSTKVSQKYENYCKHEKKEDGFNMVLKHFNLSNDQESYTIKSNSTTYQTVLLDGLGEVNLIIIPVSRLIEIDGKDHFVYDIYYAFTDLQKQKVLFSKVKREAFTFVATSTEEDYEPEFVLSRVLVNDGYSSNVLSSREEYKNLARQRFYFVSSENEEDYRIFDNLVYISGDELIMTDMTDLYMTNFKGDKNGDILKKFGELQEENGLFYLKYPPKEGKEVKRSILRPDLMIKKGN